MLGHLVFTGHAADRSFVAEAEPRPSRARALAQDSADRQSGWLGRLMAQFLPRR